MPLALNSARDVAALRPDDKVLIDVRRSPAGIDRLRIDLSDRGEETHALVALPALPNDFAKGAVGQTRLWIKASYRDDQGRRLPFVVYVAAFRGGKSLAEEQVRYFAGPEVTPLVLDVAIPAEADTYELVFYADRRYRGLLDLSDIRLTQGTQEYAIGAGEHVRREVSLERRWYQDGTKVVCSSVYGDHWAEMPAGWRLDEVHPAALAAADWILYSGADRLAFGVNAPAPDPDDAQRRYIGSRTLLSYSLGTDSTAALTLLPDDSMRYYCRRPYVEYFTRTGASIKLPDPTPWEERLRSVENLIVVANTFEQIQLAAGGRHGFAHNFGYAAIGLLMADFTDAGVLAFGSVLEQVFLRSGHLFADVIALPRSAYNSLRRLINSAGLFLALPTAGCSEVLTSRISDDGRYSGLAISCPRATPDGAACGTCFKCFRKLRLEGRLDAPDPEESVLHVLEKYPLKSATSVVYAAKRSGFRHPNIDRYWGVDLGFLERYFDYAVEEMLPKELAHHVRREFAAMGIHPMTADDEYRLRTLGQVFWPESFTWSRAGLPDPAEAGLTP